MRRREVLALMAAIASPAFAERHRVRTVGYLTPGTAGAKHLSATMATRGWVEGRDVRYEVRRVARDGSDAAQGAADLVRKAAVLQLGTLRALVPGLKRVFFVTSGADTTAGPAPAHLDAARSVGLAADFAKVDDRAALERLLASLRRGADAAWIALPPAGATAQQVAASALSHRIATHGLDAASVRAGCLMSYWILHSDPLGRVGALVDQILRGADPAQMPFELPDKTEFVLNRATAGALGLRVSAEVLLRATEVIG